MEQSNLAKLISNYGSKLWSMISVFIFIPLYIKFLGTENYGLIGFYALLLGIISFADSGMSSAIIKEFSQDSDSNYKYSVLKNLEKIYIFVCSIICIAIFFSSSFIADRWISANGISKNDLIYYVRLIGLGVTTQLTSSLYFGALFALNRQVGANLLQFFWSFSRSALVLLLFLIFSKSIEIYFIWQIVCNVGYILILRSFIIKQLSIANAGLALKKEFNKLPRHMVQYIGGMIFIAIISAINIQADKLVTSSMFDLATFGFYNIASSLAQIPVIFATPLIAFAFPLFSKFSSGNEDDAKIKSLEVFNKVFYLINIIGLVLTSGIFFYSKEILTLWTGNSVPSSVFNEIVVDVQLLIIGSFFLALQLPLYYLLLSKGKTKYTIYQGGVQLLIGIPLLYYCSNKYGLIGIPIPWLLINFAAFVYLFIIVNKGFLNFATSNFYKEIMFFPAIICVFINLVFYMLYYQLQIAFLPFLLVGCAMSILASLIYFNFKSKRSLRSYKHFYNFPNE